MNLKAGLCLQVVAVPVNEFDGSNTSAMVPMLAFLDAPDLVCFKFMLCFLVRH